MPAALLGTSYDKRGKLPPVRVVNRFVERTQTNQVSGVALLPRPGLSVTQEDGSGPIRGVFREAGLFSGDIFSVSDDELYRDGTLVPFASGVTEIAGTDRTKWAGTDVGTNSLFFVNGGVLYLYQGVEVDEVTVPNGDVPTDVTEINGYIIVQVSNGGRRYFIEPGEITISALNFFTAESSPDNSVATIALGSELWLIDQQSGEVWFPTGVADAPFQRAEGRTFAIGATSRDCVVEFDNTVFFVGEDSSLGRVAYRLSDVPQRVSDNTIEQKLRESTSDIYSIAFILDGHAFWLISTSVGTFGYDVATGAWAEWASYERDRFRVQCGVATAGEQLALGDDTDGRIYTLVPSQGNDDGDPIIRIVGGGVPMIQRQSVDSLSIVCTTGTATDPSLWPVLSARFSKDGGETWSDLTQRSIGRTGQYAKRVVWNRLGQYRPPGFLFELWDSDDVQMSLSYALVNEAY